MDKLFSDEYGEKTGHYTPNSILVSDQICAGGYSMDDDGFPPFYDGAPASKIEDTGFPHVEFKNMSLFKLPAEPMDPTSISLLEVDSFLDHNYSSLEPFNDWERPPEGDRYGSWSILGVMSLDEENLKSTNQDIPGINLNLSDQSISSINESDIKPLINAPSETGQTSTHETPPTHAHSDSHQTESLDEGTPNQNSGCPLIRFLYKNHAQLTKNQGKIDLGKPVKKSVGRHRKNKPLKTSQISTEMEQYLKEEFKTIVVKTKKYLRRKDALLIVTIRAVKRMAQSLRKHTTNSMYKDDKIYGFSLCLMEMFTAYTAVYPIEDS
jgi:hypothetical protein